jgi:predicted dithiol-disulfide oxidoreductase (DUF899 family)
MLSHLESGNCESEVVEDQVRSWAFQCYQSRYYVTEDEDYPFECPGCGEIFGKVSAMFQHAESDVCDTKITARSPLGKLLQFLRSRVY